MPTARVLPSQTTKFHYLTWLGVDDNGRRCYDVKHVGCEDECAVGFCLVEMGEDSFGVWENDLDGLVVGGVYYIEYWEDRYSTGYSEPEIEYGIRIVDRVA